MRTHRSAAVLSTAAILVALVAGCSSGAGSTSSSGGNASSGGTASGEASAVKYAQCMRENGINVPDPGPEGGLMMPDGYDSSDPKNQEIEQKCSQYLPPVSDEDRAKNDEDMLAFAQCMRENGVDMPDPVDGALEVPMVDQETLTAASEKCADVMKQGATE